MNLSLRRTHAVGNRTFGKLYADGVFLCHTLEDKIREVPGRPPEEWKIHGQTAIPQGVYRVSLERSPRFGDDTLTVHDVPGFVGVRMHAGNTEADTEGCPLLGMQVSDAGIVAGTSRPAVALVRTTVRIGIERDGFAEMEVSNPLEVS